MFEWIVGLSPESVNLGRMGWREAAKPKAGLSFPQCGKTGGGAAVGGELIIENEELRIWGGSSPAPWRQTARAQQAEPLRGRGREEMNSQAQQAEPLQYSISKLGGLGGLGERWISIPAHPEDSPYL